MTSFQTHCTCASENLRIAGQLVTFLVEGVDKLITSDQYLERLLLVLELHETLRLLQAEVSDLYMHLEEIKLEDEEVAFAMNEQSQLLCLAYSEAVKKLGASTAQAKN